MAATLALGVAAEAAAGAQSSSFNGLLAELQLRSAELAGTTDRDLARQRKAIDKTIASIGKPSVSLAADLKIAGKVAKALARIFPEEIAQGIGIAILLDGAVESMLGEVLALLDALNAAVDRAGPGRCRDKSLVAAELAEDLLAAAEVHLAAADRVKLAVAALKLVLRGTTGAQKCPPPADGGDTENRLEVSVNGSPWTPAIARYYRGDDIASLVLKGTDGGLAGARDLNLVAQGVAGPGEYPVHPYSSYVDGRVSFLPPGDYVVTGSIAVTSFQYTDDGQANDAFAGSFDVTFTQGQAAVRITGTYELTKPLF